MASRGEHGEERLTRSEERLQLGQGQRLRRHQPGIAREIRLELGLAAHHRRFGRLQLLLHLRFAGRVALVRGTEGHEGELAARGFALAERFLVFARGGLQLRIGRVQPGRHVGDGARRVALAWNLGGGERLGVERFALGGIGGRRREQRVHVRHEAPRPHPTLGHGIGDSDLRLLPEGLERGRHVALGLAEPAQLAVGIGDSDRIPEEQLPSLEGSLEGFSRVGVSLLLDMNLAQPLIRLPDPPCAKLRVLPRLLNDGERSRHVPLRLVEPLEPELHPAQGHERVGQPRILHAAALVAQPDCLLGIRQRHCVATARVLGVPAVGEAERLVRGHETLHHQRLGANVELLRFLVAAQIADL